MAVQDRESGEGRAALAALCEIYRAPILSFARACARAGEDPADLAQGFFTYVIEKNEFARADRERGRLRSFLRRALRSYIASRGRHERRIKRGGNQVHVSLDEVDDGGFRRHEPAHWLDAERLYTRQWAWTLIEQARERLRAHYERRGKQALYTALEEFLDEPTGEEGCYAPLAEALGMSQGTLRVNVCRLRQNYRKLLRAAIGQTLSHPGQIDDEIRYLLQSLEDGDR